MTGPGEWSLLLQWGPRAHRDAELARFLARTVAAVHSVAPAARFWLDFDNMIDVWFDGAAAPDDAMQDASRLVADRRRDDADAAVRVWLVSQDREPELSDGDDLPITHLQLDVGDAEDGAVNTVEWRPAVLTETVLADPVAAEGLLAELVSAWDPDSAVWMRSDLDRAGRLAGPNGPVAGWITYLSHAVGPAAASAASLPTARPLQRGVLIGADRPAGRFDDDDAGTLARVLTAPSR